MNKFDSKHSGIADMFAGIAARYDLANRIISLGLDKYWRKALLRTMFHGMDKKRARAVLDLGAGTLELSLLLADACPSAKIFALDFCPGMLKNAASKLCGQQKNNIVCLLGNAIRLPVADNTMHAVCMAFSLRNITERKELFKEIYRVLMPGGQFWALELTRPDNRLIRALHKLYLAHVLPAIAGLITGQSGAYAYLSDSIGSFPKPEQLMAELQLARFSAIRSIPLNFGVVRLTGAEKALTLA